MKIGKYDVDFFYFQGKLPDSLVPDNLRGKVQGLTQCVVLNLGGYWKLGESFCSIHDKFDRKVGRKVAFAKAIEALSKPERTELWEEYKKKVRYQ